MVKIRFDTSNDEFAEDGMAAVAAILRQIALVPKAGKVRDINGNVIGEWSATIDAEPVEG